jgi:hypothetical protein
MNVTPKSFLVTILFSLIFLVACLAEPPEETPPTPTATRISAAPRNENVEALNSAQAALRHQAFGFAPLLMEDEARIVIENNLGAEQARLIYPEQPLEPAKWPSVDSFVSACSVRQVMSMLPQVRRVTLGKFGVSASIGATAEKIEHYAAWIMFNDGTRAVIDMSPLSTNFAPRHAPDQMLPDDAEVETIFAERRTSVDLGQLQPMKVIRHEGEPYYLVAKVLVHYDRYDFSLRLYPVQIADPMRPMNLRPGVTADIEINRNEFEQLQALAKEEGPAIFKEKPELLLRRGGNSEPLTPLLDEQLELMWHLVTKFEHEGPDPSVATPTPAPTDTPMPTATPEPTGTPRGLPLITS